MNTTLTLHKRPLSITHLAIICALVFAIAPPQAVTQPAVGQPALGSGADMLMFQSENHLLRFGAAKANLVGINHQLEVEFLGATGSAPEAANSAKASAVQPLEQVNYDSLWPGIGAVFSGEAGAVAKSEYRVAPGGKPEMIRLRYSTAPLLQADGSLVFAFPDAQGEIIESAPVAWQIINAEQVSVEVAFHLLEDGTVGFWVGKYHPGYELIIDPAYRWHSFFGGRTTVDLVGMCNIGSVYAVGTVNSFVSRTINTDLAMHYHGGKDIGVFKMTNGTYIWERAVYFGSDSDDEAKSVACDGTSMYIVGTSTKTWLGYSDQSPLHAHSGNSDMAVIKLSYVSEALAYNWHTFWGSASQDLARDIAVNGTDLYIAGASYDSWLGTGNVSPKHAYQGDYDFAVLKLTTNGAYSWHTFFGGAQTVDTGSGIASSGTSVWVVGASDGTWKGGAATTTDPLHAHSGGNDITALLLNTSGDYIWHTFFGSTSNETASAVSLDGSNGSGYIVGYGTATWLGNGTGTNTPKHAHSGGSDITVLCLNAGGAYQWHTFYGSSGTDEGRDIVRDFNNKLLIAGYSSNEWFAPAIPEMRFGGGGGDGVFLKLDLNGNYEKHDFYGGIGLDGLYGLNLNGNLGMLSGFSEATWNGLDSEAPTPAHTQSHDGLRVFQASGNGYSSHGFLGSTRDDTLHSLTVDSSGNIIIVGEAAMAWRGPSNQAPLKTYNGGTLDLVVIKLNSSGTYLWHTIYGGILWDTPSGVVCDGSGNIYVTGFSNAPWNGPTGQAPVRAYSDGHDWYVLKLNSSGAYQWHTFLGGNTLDSSDGIAYSSSAASLFVVGDSLSTSWAGLAPIKTHSGGYDVAVASLNPTTGALVWYAFYGTDADDYPGDVSVFGSSIYVAGSSPESWNGPSGQLPLHATDGGTEWNAFVLKLTSAGSYSWHTFYGNRSFGTDIAFDQNENVYLLASNSYSWNGPAGQLPTHPYAEYAPFVLKLTSGGTYQWHGFFGELNTCLTREITYSVLSEQLTVVCEAAEPWEAYGFVDPINPYNGMRDGLLIRITKNGIYKAHTYLGSPADDTLNGLALQPMSETIIVGGSSSTSWSYRGSAPTRVYQGGLDMFVTAFAPFTKSVYLPVTLR